MKYVLPIYTRLDYRSPEHNHPRWATHPKFRQPQQPSYPRFIPGLMIEDPMDRLCEEEEDGDEDGV